MGPLWLLPGGLCVCVRKRAGAKSVHMHVCVFHRSGGWCCRSGGGGGGGGEIYLSEQRRIGDGEERESERRGMCRERGGGQKKGKCRKGRFIVERGWSILRRDSRAWRGRNKWAMQNRVPGVQNALYFTCINFNCTDCKQGGVFTEQSQ